jgi:hypothetical protein
VHPSFLSLRPHLPPTAALEYPHCPTQFTIPRTMSNFNGLNLHGNSQSDNDTSHLQGYTTHVEQGGTQARATYSLGEAPVPSYSPEPENRVPNPLWQPNPEDYVNIRIQTPEDQTYSHLGASTPYSVASWIDSSSSNSTGIAGPSNYYPYSDPADQVFHPYPTVQQPGSPSSNLSSPHISSTTPTSLYSASPSPSQPFPPQVFI